MTTKPPYDLLSVRAETGAGSREWFLRAGRGLRSAWQDVSTANRMMGEMRVDRRHHNPF